MNSLSSFLFASPTFTEGVARILDFGDTLTVYNESLTPEQADALAMSADWRVVGDDLRRAIAKFAEDHPELAANVKHP